MRYSFDTDVAESFMACSLCYNAYRIGNRGLPLWLRRDMQQCP